MPLASWIVAAHERPHLLEHTLAVLHEALWPRGWEWEIVVATGDADSAAIAKLSGCRVVLTGEPNPGGKRNQATRECRGELVLVTDDDDFQSRLRPIHAIAAYEDGHALSGIRTFRRLHMASGNVVRWDGRGVQGQVQVVCGTARNYSRRVLMQVGGWNPALASLEDGELHKRLTRRRRGSPGLKELDLGDALATTTIITQHGANIFPRPEVPVGIASTCGDYRIVGEGHYSQLPDFPKGVAWRLPGILG